MVDPWSACHAWNWGAFASDQVLQEVAAVASPSSEPESISPAPLSSRIPATGAALRPNNRGHLCAKTAAKRPEPAMSRSPFARANLAFSAYGRSHPRMASPSAGGELSDRLPPCCPPGSSGKATGHCRRLRLACPPRRRLDINRHACLPTCPCLEMCLQRPSAALEHQRGPPASHVLKAAGAARRMSPPSPPA